MKYDEKKYPWIWKRTSRKGYCFTARIPCRVIAAAGKRIEIAALLVDGSERIHRVNRESLEHSPCHCFGECRGLELALTKSRYGWSADPQTDRELRDKYGPSIHEKP